MSDNNLMVRNSPLSLPSGPSHLAPVDGLPYGNCVILGPSGFAHLNCLPAPGMSSREQHLCSRFVKDRESEIIAHLRMLRLKVSKQVRKAWLSITFKIQQSNKQLSCFK